MGVFSRPKTQHHTGIGCIFCLLSSLWKVTSRRSHGMFPATSSLFLKLNISTERYISLLFTLTPGVFAFPSSIRVICGRSLVAGV